jgi:hypothetical protein
VSTGLLLVSLSPYTRVQWHELTNHKDGVSSCNFNALSHRLLNDRVTIVTVYLLAAQDPAATTSKDGARIEFTDANVNGYLLRTLPPGVALPGKT